MPPPSIMTVARTAHGAGDVPAGRGNAGRIEYTDRCLAGCGLGREEGLTVRRRRLIRAGAALVLGAAAVYAQLMPYDEWRKARERREEAEARLEWGLAAAAVFAGGWVFGQVARRRRKLPGGAIAEAFSRPPSVLGARICKALGVAAILLAAGVVASYYASCAKDPGTARIGPPFLTTGPAAL